MRRVVATERGEKYFHFGVKTPVMSAPTCTDGESQIWISLFYLQGLLVKQYNQFALMLETDSIKKYQTLK